MLGRLSRPVARCASSPLAALPRGRPAAARYAHHDTHHSAGPEESYPEEGFNKPVWRNGALLAIAFALAYRLSPTAHDAIVAAAEVGPEAKEEHPITRYIAHQLTPRAGLWEERQAKHLELAKQAAEDKLLFQEAERPRVRRMRYPGSFSQASPNNIEVGSQADLSDLVIKSEKDDFSFGKSEEAEEE